MSKKSVLWLLAGWGIALIFPPQALLVMFRGGSNAS